MSSPGTRPRVGLLTYGLDRPLSGVSRVAWELGRALGDGQQCDVFYLTPYRRGPFRSDGSKNWYLPACRHLPGLMMLGGSLIALAARRLRLDIVHDPVGISPFTWGSWAGRFRRILAIHDAIAFRYPEGYPWLNNLLHRRYVPATLRHVDAVITDSHHARDDIQRFLHVPTAQLHVIPLGVADDFRPRPSAEARCIAARYGLDGPYVLSVGKQEARKNLGGLLAAFARLRSHSPEHQLAIVGPRYWKYEGLSGRISELGLTQAVKVIGYLPDADLPALYGGADLFVLPSLYEGFGLPVLEAMACGTPVVSSDRTSLPEVAGDAALLADPTDPSGFAEAMRRALCDAKLREDLRRKGLARAAQFTWRRTAELTTAIYRRLLAESCP